MKFSEYTIKNIEEIFEILKTSENGLSKKEVESRQRIHGFNEVKVKEVTLIDIFLRQFKSSFVYLLLLAFLVAFLINERIDSLVILLFVLINVSLGFFQEARAEKAAKVLKSYLPSESRVKRDGEEAIVDKKFLVPGDIVLLEAGNIVPADLRITKAENLLVDEEVLSGESVPLSKTSQLLFEEQKEVFGSKNILFAGTSVISGEVEGVVIAIGKQTFFGEIAKLATGISKESTYEKNLLRFSKIVLRIVVGTIIIVYLLNLIITKLGIFNRGQITDLDFLIFSIALIVSIIPEALPVVATFALSQGAIALARKKVVVKRLSAIEGLGSIEILCTDKTGTLTENKLSLEDIYSLDKNKCLLYGLLCSSYIKEKIESLPNPFDSAILQKASSEIRGSLKNFNSLSEISFDPFRLKTSMLIEDQQGKRILIVKGAPEVILKISSQWKDSLAEKEIKEKIEKEGRAGKRILALAYKEFEKGIFTEDDEKDLKFLGYFSFADPLKKTAKSAITLAGSLGLRIKILTGDSLEVAGAIAKEIGLIKDQNEVILGNTLEILSEENFEKICDDYSVFARISPVMKFKILTALQKKYEVGFLGEGVNDAPALKVANVAIAVKEGAEISREVSDIILLKKDLRAIIDGIQEGRNIFYNIQKYIKNTLASNFGNFYSIAAIALVIPFLPMLPVQILLVNLLSDFPLIAIATDKIDIEELKRSKLYQLHQIIFLIVLLAIVSTAFDFIFFAIFYKSGDRLLQTLWFIESILTEIALIFSVRTPRFFLKARRPSSPLILFSILAVAITILLPFTNFGREFFHFVSPPASALFIVAFVLISYFFASEIVKLIYFRHWKLKLERSL